MITSSTPIFGECMKYRQKVFIAFLLVLGLMLVPLSDFYTVDAATTYGTSDSTPKMVNQWVWVSTSVSDTTSNPNNMYGRVEYSNVMIHRDTSSNRYYLEITGGNNISAANVAEMLNHFISNSEECAGIYFHGASIIEDNWWGKVQNASSYARTIAPRIDIEAPNAMTIGSRAFYGYNGKLHFYNSIFESIGDEAFYNMGQQFEFYGTVKNMSARAFANSHVTYAYIKSRTGQTTDFGDAVFKNCRELNAFRCDSTYFNLSTEMFQDSGLEEFITGSNTKIIGTNTQNCFTGSNITSLDLRKLEAGSIIGDYFCQDCPALLDVKLSTNITGIGLSAFEGCKALNSVTFTKASVMVTTPSLSSIGAKAFKDCSSLSKIVMEGEQNTVLWDTIRDIEDSAFQNCTFLDIKKLPANDTFKVIRVNTFQNSGITQLSLPDQITQLEDNAFRDCSKLTSVNSDNPNGTLIIDDNVFRDDTALTSVQLPAGTTKIGNHAFRNDTGIIELNFTWLNSLAEIGTSAFENTKLKAVDLSDHAISKIGERAFADIKELTTITLNPSQILNNPGSTVGETPDYSKTEFYVDTYVKTTINGIPATPTEQDWTCWDYWYYANRNGMVINFMVRGQEEAQVVNCNLGTNDKNGNFQAGLYETLLNQKTQFIPKNHLVVEDFEGNKDGELWYRLDENNRRVPFSNDGEVIDAEWCTMGSPITFTLYSYAPYFVTLHNLDGTVFEVLEVMDGESCGTLPNPVVDGCTFRYWCKDKENPTQYNIMEPVNTSFDLYPHCDVQVKFRVDGLPDGVESPDAALLEERTIALGDKIVRPSLRNLEEYRFDDFYTEKMEQFDFDAPIEHHTTIVANYISNNQIQVRLHMMDEEGTVTSETYMVGDTYKLPEAMANDGQAEFKGFASRNPNVVGSLGVLKYMHEPEEEIELTGDMDIYAIYSMPITHAGDSFDDFKAHNDNYGVVLMGDVIRGCSVDECSGVGSSTYMAPYKDAACTIPFDFTELQYQPVTVYWKESTMEGRSTLSIIDSAGNYSSHVLEAGSVITNWSELGITGNEYRDFEGVCTSDGTEVSLPWTVPSGQSVLKVKESIIITLDPMGGTLKSVPSFRYECGKELLTDNNALGDNLLVYANDDLILENAAKIILDTPPVKSGVEFFGWYYDKAGTEPFKSGDKLKEHTTLYARYETNVHTVYNMFNDKDWRVLDDTQIEESFLLDGESALDHNIRGWEYTRASIDEAKLGLSTDEGTWYEFEPGVTKVNGDIAISPIGTVTVSFVTGTNATQIESQELKRGDCAIVPRTPLRFDAEFIGWFTSAEYATVFDFDKPIKENTIAYAKWKMNDPERVAVTVVYPTQTVTYSAIKGLAFEEENRYDIRGTRYRGLFYDKGYTEPYDVATPIMEETSLYAKYTITISANTMGGSVITPLELLYGQGAIVEGTPTKAGSKFAGWYTDVQYKDKFVEGSPLYEDTWIYAKWTAKADTTNGSDEPAGERPAPKYQAYTANGAQPLGYYVPETNEKKPTFTAGYVDPLGEGRAAEDIVANLDPDVVTLGDVPKTGDDSFDPALLFAGMIALAFSGAAIYYLIRRAKQNDDTAM